MKKLSKLIALLLALALAFCLVACDKDEKNKTDADKILGNWVCSFDLREALREELAESLGDDSVAPNRSIYVNLMLTFDDGAFTLTAEVDKNSLVSYMEAMIDNMIDYLYDMMEDQGVSQKEFEDAIKSEYGKTLREYVREQVDLLLEDAADEMSFEQSGYYELDEEKGCIYIGEDRDELNSKEEAIEYRFSGNKLIVSGIISDGEKLDDPINLKEYGMELPWEFNKD